MEFFFADLFLWSLSSENWSMLSLYHQVELSKFVNVLSQFIGSRIEILFLAFVFFWPN